MVSKKKDEVNNLDESMVQNIKSYGNEIEKMKSFVDSIRKVPGMYIGHLGNAGYLNMVREVFQNSIDEIIKPKSPANMVYIFYNEITHECVVEDNGRGYPFDLMIDGFTTPHMSSNYNKKPYEYSSGRHGVGAKASNALSDKFIIESYILGEARKVTFNCGCPTKKGIEKIKNPGKQGTRIYLHPDYSIMGEITLLNDEILDLVTMIIHLVAKGAKCIFEGVRLDGSTFRVDVQNLEGLEFFLSRIAQQPIVKPIYFANDTGYLKAEVCFTFDSASLSGEVIESFANTCPARGTHLVGFMNGLTRFFRSYMNKIYLLNSKKKITITDSDIKAGLRGVVNVYHLNPNYNGQAKEELDNKDMQEFVNNLVYTGLDQWAKDNPTDLQKIAKIIKEVAEIRMKTDEGKIKLSNNYKSSALNNGMPAKYVKPNRKRVELWICEGDSAAGSLKSKRNSNTQGVFPIRGKLPNAFKTTPAKMLANEEISGILTIIGGGYGKNFNLKTVSWDKLVLASDSDTDGSHIANLFLMFALLYMRPLVEDGRLYRAIPPLFGMKVSNAKRARSGHYDPNSQSQNNSSKYKYFTTKLDYVQYKQAAFSKNYVIQTLDGKRLSSHEIIELILKNDDYVEFIENVAFTFAIDKLLLEMVLINLNKKNFKKSIESAYRFLRVDKINGVTTINGTTDKSQTIILNDRMLHICEPFKEFLGNNLSMYYKVNGNVMSIYQIMKLITGSEDANITRYKGLGEMDPLQLYESTMDPEHRTLIRYTTEDIEKDIELIRYLEGNKAELLKNTGNLKRRDLE